MHSIVRTLDLINTSSLHPLFSPHWRPTTISKKLRRRGIFHLSSGMGLRCEIIAVNRSHIVLVKTCENEGWVRRQWLTFASHGFKAHLLNDKLCKVISWATSLQMSLSVIWGLTRRNGLSWASCHVYVPFWFDKLSVTGYWRCDLERVVLT